ncbi:hypothetical protein D9M68_542180 [compost metagenome]
MGQRPGLATGFIEDVVDLQPGGLDDFLADLRHLAGGRGGFRADVGVQAHPADAGGQALGQGTEARGDVAQPVVQVVGTGIELRVGLLGVGQAGQVAVQGADAFLVLGLGGGQCPALVVEVEARLGLGQVRVFRGLRLGAGEVLAQGTGQVAHLDQHAVFPARHVVQPEAGRRQVVGEVAAALVEQGLGHGLEGFHRGVAADHLALGALGRRLGILLHREEIGLATPVPAHHHAGQQVDHQQAGEGAAQPDTAEVAAHVVNRIIDAVTRVAHTLLPVQHGSVLQVSISTERLDHEPQRWLWPSPAL